MTRAMISLDEMMQGVDVSRIQAIPERYRDLGSNSPMKFSDWRRYGGDALGKARRLALQESTGKRILDIGCAFGYYVKACMCLGHDATGLDFHRDYYEEVSEIMGTKVIWHGVGPPGFLPDELTGYDVIAMHGFGLPLGCPNRSDQWGLYSAMIQEVLSRLNAGGVLDKMIHYERVPWLGNQRRWKRLVGDRGTVEVRHNFIKVTLRA